jgi:5-deoxy-D-glucuronate isomerase
MRVAEFLSNLEAAGFSVTTNGPDLVITLASKLTDPQRQFIRQNKAEIMDLLTQEQPSGDSDLLVEVWTPSGTRFTVKADSPEHAVNLKRWNPAPVKQPLT